MSVQKIPTTVITGFLGAGKTTLIRNLMANANGRRIALLINEFGEVGVDAEILKGCGDASCPDDDVIELANGCICCTVADDFLPAMKKLLDRARPPEHIVIETSGLALPQPLIRAFNWPEVKSRLTVDAVVTVVDAMALSEGRFADDEAAVAAQRAADPSVDHENPIKELFEDQLNCADMVILSKSDLLAPDQIETMKTKLGTQVRPGTTIIASGKGTVEVTTLIGSRAAAENDMHNRLSRHEMEGETQHDHDDFISFSVSLGEVEREPLLSRIAQVLSGREVLRLKGFAAIAGSPSRLLVQAVGPRLDSYFDRMWKADEQRVTELVVIAGKAVDQARIEALLRG